eukprot:13199-Heterococcus_DN1.PRE.1
MHPLTLALLLPFARAFHKPAAWRNAAAPASSRRSTPPLSQIAPQSEYLDSLASPVHDADTDDNKDAKQESAIDWRAVWYPVAIDADLDRKLPLQLTLLNEELALW